MTAAISYGLLILLLYHQNVFAQQVSNNNANNAALSQQRSNCNSAAGITYNPQQSQQINWQQANIQDLQQPQSFQAHSQVVNQNPVTEIFSALHNLRYSPQTTQTVNPSYIQTDQGASYPQPTNPQYSQAPDSTKPTFTFQFVPVSQKCPENQVQNAVPVQFLTSGQSPITSQQGPSYIVQKPSQTSSPQSQNSQNQPILFTVNPQQSSGQNQPMVYALQPAQSSQTNQKAPPTPNKSSDPMELLMSQLQSSSGNFDMSSVLPLLMNSKQEKSSGMKAMLPLIMSLLSDRGCGCPHCGCPYNKAEPTVHGGYSNQIDYSQQSLPKNPVIPEFKNESNEVEKEVITKSSKNYKTNVMNDLSEETSEEDDDDYDEDYEG